MTNVKKHSNNVLQTTSKCFFLSLVGLEQSGRAALDACEMGSCPLTRYVAEQTWFFAVLANSCSET